MDLRDFWRRDGLNEDDLWSNWDWYYRIGLLQFALDNKNSDQHKLWLYNIFFNFITQLRRINDATFGHLPETIDDWLKRNDKLYADWQRQHALPANAPNVTLTGDIVGKLSDPLSFPRDSVIYGAWRGLAEAIQIIDKRMTDLETERRKALLDAYTLRRKIDHLTKLVFVQERFASTLGLAMTTNRHLASNG